MENKLVVSSTPHLRTPETIDCIMRDVLIALIPPLLVSIWLFGLNALWTVAIATIAAMLTESIILKKIF